MKSLGGFFEESDNAETESEGVEEDRLMREKVRAARDKRGKREILQAAEHQHPPPDFVELSEPLDDQIGFELDFRVNTEVISHL